MRIPEARRRKEPAVSLNPGRSQSNSMRAFRPASSLAARIIGVRLQFTNSGENGRQSAMFLWWGQHDC